LSLLAKSESAVIHKTSHQDGDGLPSKTRIEGAARLTAVTLAVGMIIPLDREESICLCGITFRAS
jgi:hypothetical protein